MISNEALSLEALLHTSDKRNKKSVPIVSNANLFFLLFKLLQKRVVIASTNVNGNLAGQLDVMVAVKSPFLLQKDGIVNVYIGVLGRVQVMQDWIHIASEILVAKKEDVAVVTVKAIREHSTRTKNVKILVVFLDRDA